MDNLTETVTEEGAEFVTSKSADTVRLAYRVMSRVRFGYQVEISDYEYPNMRVEIGRMGYSGYEWSSKREALTKAAEVLRELAEAMEKEAADA